MSQGKWHEGRPLRTVLWRRLDTSWLERCTLIEDRGRPLPRTWTLEGTVIGESDGVPLDVSYRVGCDGSWATGEVEVVVRLGTEAREVRLEVDEGGRWLLDRTELSELRGSYDVDLAFSPSTNTLPIRRLDLAVGDSAEIRTAWVRFPELTVESFPQRYTRLGPDRFLFESLTSEFRAELVVDDLGLVIEYPGLWERSADSNAPTPAPHPTR